MNTNIRSSWGFIAMALLLLAGVVSAAIFFSDKTGVYECEDLEPNAGLNLNEEEHLAYHHAGKLDWMEYLQKGCDQQIIVSDTEACIKLNGFQANEAMRTESIDHHRSQDVLNHKAFNFTLQKYSFSVQTEGGERIYSVTMESYYGSVNQGALSKITEGDVSTQKCSSSPTVIYSSSQRPANNFLARFVKRRKATAGA